jgi:hypothetical protein
MFKRLGTLVLAGLSFFAGLCVETPHAQISPPGTLVGVACTAACDTASLNTQGASAVAFTLVGSATPTGFSYIFQGYDGSQWKTLPYCDVTTTPPTSCAVAALSATSGQWIVPTIGYAKVRFHLTAITGGTATITANANQGAGAVLVVGGAINATVSATTTGGLAGDNVAPSGNPVQTGCIMTSSEVAAGTDTRVGAIGCDLERRLIVQPYAAKQEYVSGSATSTNTAAHTIISAPGSLKNWITSIQCGRDDGGTTAIHVTFNDTNSTVMVIPNSGGGGGNNMTFATPITAGTTTAFQFTANTGTSTVYCNAQGYTGA